jgi:5-methylcytosine-specific restriction endonuclease McrA
MDNLMATTKLTEIYDNETVISDLTEINDNETTNSFNFEDKLAEIRLNFNGELNKLTLDVLKEKCKEQNINGLSKMKKPDLVQVLETEFFKLLIILKDKKTNDLKMICKQIGIKGISGIKKEILIYQILQHNSLNMKFRLNIIQNESEQDKDVKNIKSELVVKKEPINLIEQLEKQKLEIEIKLNDESKKQREIETKLNEEIKRQKLEIETKLNEEITRQKLEIETKKIEDEIKQKDEIKRKKQNIPKNIRIIVWNHYIGEDIIKHKCLCCKKVTISNTNFDVGHVLSEKNSGTHEINNLRPICFSCNHSMGTENMIDFVVKFGLFIG